MKLFDFFKSKKKRKKTGSGAEGEAPVELSGVDPEEIVPPETRYTQEYKDFLASRESEERTGEGPERGAELRDEKNETEGNAMKTLVTCFSASGVTAEVAKRLAEALGAPLYEIRPAVPYTPEDLDWRNKQSRSSVEMGDKACRPALADTDAPVADSDLIFLGYPVWWYREPSIIDTFLEAYDFKGKGIVLFATSGVSEIGEEAPARISALSGAEVLPGKRFPADVSREELKAWAAGIA